MADRREAEIQALDDEQLLEKLQTLRVERRHWLGEHAKAVVWDAEHRVATACVPTDGGPEAHELDTAASSHIEAAHEAATMPSAAFVRGTLGALGTLPPVPPDLAPPRAHTGTGVTLAMLEHLTSDLLAMERVAAARRLTVTAVQTAEMVTAPVSSTWRVAIPEGVRTALDIQRGHRVGFVVDDSGLRLVNATQLEELALGLWLPVFGHSQHDTPMQVAQFAAKVVARARAVTRHSEPIASRRLEITRDASD